VAELKVQEFTGLPTQSCISPALEIAAGDDAPGKLALSAGNWD